MGGVFLTGGTGFVGGHVLRRLAEGGSGPLHCLVRDPAGLAGAPGDVRPVVGDLGSPDTWADALTGCDTVVHLAALTGKARPEEHRRVNAEATGVLLERAAAAGVRRFLFVSTIAVTYPEKRAYPYARSKEDAEGRVRESGLDWAIVRPTVVLGPGSPLWDKFRSLAAAPVMPLLGGGRNTIQPVHVGDVAECVAQLLDEERLGGRTLELGGRDTVTMESFLRRIRRGIRGKDGPALPVPVRPIIALLAAMEPVAFSVLPITAGQLYAFAYDASAADSDDPPPPRGRRRGVAELIREHLEAERARVPAVPPDVELDRECSVFARYLAGIEPGDYVRAKYRAAHQPGAFGPAREDADPLTRIARRGPGFARIADAWASVLAREGTLRRKLVLLLAILESTGETSPRVDSPDRGTRAGFLLGLVPRALLFVATLLVALVAVPLLRLRAGRDGGGAAS